MILTKAIKLLATQLQLLCIVAVFQRTQSTDSNIPNNDIQQEQPNRQLAGPLYFNLRLFWQRGYRWQETSKETFWCLTCTSYACNKNSKVEVQRCNRSDSRQQWYFDKNKIRSRKNKKMCLQRSGRSIRMQPCTRSRFQKWGDLRKDRPFELQIPGNRDKCASQHHHPKDKEVVYMESCKLAEKADTSKWVVY